LSTIHEDMAEALLDDMLRANDGPEQLADTRALFRAGDFDEDYVAAIGQTQHAPAYWPMEQMAAYQSIHTGLMSGEFAHIPISVGADPGADADRTGNSMKLEGLHEAFRARLDMDQNGAEADGRFWWPETIRAQRSSGLGLVEEHETTPVYMPHAVPAACVPLEVGYSKPSCTLLHMWRDGGVARWPYGSDVVHLLLNMRREKSRLALRRWSIPTLPVAEPAGA
jgi:hypothetical protein